MLWVHTLRLGSSLLSSTLIGWISGGSQYRWVLSRVFTSHSWSPSRAVTSCLDMALVRSWPWGSPRKQTIEPFQCASKWYEWGSTLKRRSLPPQRSLLLVWNDMEHLELLGSEEKTLGLDSKWNFDPERQTGRETGFFLITFLKKIRSSVKLLPWKWKEFLSLPHQTHLCYMHESGPVINLGCHKYIPLLKLDHDQSTQSTYLHKTHINITRGLRITQTYIVCLL